MSTYLKENDVKVKDGTDVNAIMRDMMSVILEGILDEEMNAELGYFKYDYRNKETDNSRNGYSQKTMHTSYGDMERDIPRDRKGDFEPQVIKKYLNTVIQDMEEKINLSCYKNPPHLLWLQSFLIVALQFNGVIDPIPHYAVSWL